jgi:eukaryotic-like serine/threonine-protein kinase
MKPFEPDPILSAADHELGMIIDEIVADIRNGKVISIEDWVQRFPQHEKNLRELIPTLTFAEDIQRDTSVKPNSESTVRNSLGADDVLTGNFPRKLGDFEIRQELGRGGMGVVYFAWQQSLRRPVALKILARHLTQDSRFVARFQREAQSAARLQHSNLVQVFGIGQDQGVWYYAMQLIDGSPINDVLQQLRRTQEGRQTTIDLHEDHSNSRRRAESLLQFDPARQAAANSLTWSESASYASPPHSKEIGSGQVVPGLSSEGIWSATAKNRLPYYVNIATLVRDVSFAIHYAHSKGTIHRDIKPSNLLLDRTGKIWVTDFGLAKIEEEAGLTMTGDLIGTLRYTAPEQLEGVSAPSCDIYSLGLTLYELLTLQPAIASTDKLHILYQVRQQDPTPPRAIDPRIPLDLETITLKAIAKEARSRYASAQDFGDDLQRFLDGRPIHARPVSSVTKVMSWAKRNRLAALLLLTLLTGLVVVSIFSTVAAFRFRDLAKLEMQSRLEADSALKKADVAFKQASAAETEMRRQLYISEMNLGLQSAKLPGSLPKLRRFVQRWQEDTSADSFRGWEWQLLKSLTQQEVLGIQIESNVESRLCISADRRTVAWIEKFQAVVFDLDQQQVIQRCGDSKVNINFIHLSENGSRLLVTYDSGEAVVFSVATGTIEFSQTLPVHPRTAAWHPDGNQIVLLIPDATTSRADLRVWNLQANEVKLVVRQDASTSVEHIAFNAEGTRLAASRCSDPKRSYISSACVWNSQTWEIEKQILMEGSQASCFCWSPDGERVAFGAFDGEVRIWNLQSNQIEATLKILRSVRDLDWNPSGEFLCIACDDASVLQWNTSTQKIQGVPLPHDESVIYSRYCGNGDRLVSLDRSNYIRVWDVKSGLAEQQRQLVNQFDAHQVDVLVEFSPAADHLTAGAAAPASIWRTDDGSLVKTMLGSYLNWSFDGRLLASKYNETVSIWNAADFEADATNEQLGYGILRVWSPIDYRLAGNDSRSLWIWDVKANRVQRSAEILAQDNPDSFRAITWSPDGKQIAIAANSNWLYLFDSETLDCQARFQPTTTRIHGITWSPDGKLLAVAAAQPAAVILSVETGELVKTLDGHSYEVRAIAWSPDGNRIATGGADRQLIVWNPDWESPVVSMEFDSEVRSVAWSHNNKMLAGISQNGQLKLWKAMK